MAIRTYVWMFLILLYTPVVFFFFLDAFVQLSWDFNKLLFWKWEKPSRFFFFFWFFIVGISIFASEIKEPT